MVMEMWGCVVESGGDKAEPPIDLCLGIGRASPFTGGYFCRSDLQNKSFFHCRYGILRDI